MPEAAQSKQQDDQEHGLLRGQRTGDCYLSLLTVANCEIVCGCFVEARCKHLSLEGKGESKGEVKQVWILIIVALEECGFKDTN